MTLRGGGTSDPWRSVGQPVRVSNVLSGRFIQAPGQFVKIVFPPRGDRAQNTGYENHAN